MHLCREQNIPSTSERVRHLSNRLHWRGRLTVAGHPAGPPFASGENHEWRKVGPGSTHRADHGHGFSSFAAGHFSYLTDPLGSYNLAWLVDTGYPSFVHVPHLGRQVFVAIEHIFVDPKELVYLGLFNKI